MSCFSMGMSSYDEDMLDQFQVQRHLDDLDFNHQFNTEWDWMEDNIGLTRPPPHRGCHMWIHRATNTPRGNTPFAQIALQPGVTAVDAVTTIETQWQDLGPFDTHPRSWMIRHIHHSVANSQLPQDQEHWIIATYEELAGPVMRSAVLVEVKWSSTSSCETFTTGMLLPSIVSKLMIFDQIGVLLACGTTHICSLEHNGITIDRGIINLSMGDFVVVAGWPATPEHTSTLLEPSAIAMIRSPGSNADSEEAEEEMISHDPNDDTPLDSEDEGLERKCHVLIYRPFKDVSLPQVISDYVALEGTLPSSLHYEWPDLQHLRWYEVQVHDSYYDDFPRPGCFNVYLIWEEQAALQSFGGVISLLTISWQGMTHSKAIYLISPVNKQVILQQIGLQAHCYGHGEMRCTVKRNGIELPEIGDFTSTPGQYVHVDLRPIPKQEVQLVVDDLWH